ncbi:MAG TPA: ATP-binding protein [Rhizomicrobium sp.]
MKSVAVPADVRETIDPRTIRIGKDVIELLTSGMYVSPISIYREYVQNAADAIDEFRRDKLGQPHGTIAIDINYSNRSVSIRDDGAGLSGNDAANTLTSIGGSKKWGTKARGYRGVGRLSGLAYCRELEFRTKRVGETATTSITWDCRLLRAQLVSRAFDGDLRRLIADAVSVRREPNRSSGEHFFEVHLRDVSRLKNDMLMNESMIATFLGQVAPVPFSPHFRFAAEIESRLSEIGRSPPIHLTVSGTRVFRPHQDEMVAASSSRSVKITEVEHIEMVDNDGGVAAVGWLAHHGYERGIPEGLGVRGLRARIGDLQIGDSNLFDQAFREPRFNGWCIGDIHIVDQRIAPNGRRDNFEVDHHYYNLMVQLGTLAARISQRCRTLSVSRNATNTILKTIEVVANRLRSRKPCDRVELLNLKSGVISARARLKSVGDSTLRKVLATKLDKLELSLASRKSRRGASIVTLEAATALISKVVTNREQARKLVTRLQRLST